MNLGLRLSCAWRAIALACAIIVLAGCAAQESNSRGMKLIGEGQQEQGLVLLQEATRLEPNNSRYRIDYLSQQTRLVREFLAKADDARRAGDLVSARAHAAAAARYDPANERVRLNIVAIEMEQRQRDRIAEAEKLAQAGKLEAARDVLRAAAAESPTSPAVQRALAQVLERLDRAVATRQAQVAAQSVMKKPVTLQFRDANVRLVFEAMSRTTGLNVIMDRDVRADLKTTIFVRDASVEDTVDLILLQNQLEKKELNANTLFIYPATPAKQKEYQDLQVRTFQLSNADPKYIQTVLKSVLKLKDVALDERTSTLVLRDTPDAIAVAEKVITAHDHPDAEVTLEVEVIEVSRDRLSNLGINWPDGIVATTPTDANGLLTLDTLRNLSSGELLVTPLSAALNLKLQDTDASLLASPRIRVRHKEKARILIGDKVPVITNTVTPVASGSPVVTGSVQYLDVGIKLEVEPQVYMENDVGIKLNLEVSNIVKEIQGPNGSLAYQIGTRGATTNLRLKDGETQILGGLINELDRNTAAKVPGLGQLPVLGRLFSNHAGNNLKTEIVLSITPRIVRGPKVVDSRYRDVFSGTESTVRETPLRLDPVGSVRGAAGSVPLVAPGAARAAPPGSGGDEKPAQAPGGPTAVPPAGAEAPATTAPPAGPSPGGVVSGGVATPPPGSGTPPAPQPRAVTPTPGPVDPSTLPPALRPGGIYKPAPPPQPGSTPRPPQPPPPDETADARTAPTPAKAAAASAAVRAASGAGTLELTWRGPYRVKVGETFSVALDAKATDAMTRLPLLVRYDPLVLTFLDAQLDEFASKSGVPAIKPANDATAGRISIELQAGDGKTFAGQGTLLSLRFTARAPKQQTQLMLAPIELTSAGAAAVDAIKPAPMTMRVGS